jgi:uncharacterized protein YggE
MRWILVFLAVLASPSLVPAQVPDTLAGKTVLRLSATATQTTVPDYAILRVAVTTQDKLAAEAGRSNARLVDAVVTALRETGILVDSIATGGYAVQRASPDRQGRPTGYIARAQLAVRIQALDRIGEAIDAALNAGATDVGPVEFAATSLDAVRDSAYAAAVRDVYRRADVVTATIGGTVLEAVDLTASERRAWAPCVGCEEIPPGRDPATIVLPGLITVTVIVNATFRIQVR